MPEKFNTEKSMGLYQIAVNKAELDHRSCLSIDSENRTIEFDSKPLKLTRKEFDLLYVLMQHAGAVIPREALLLRVWGYGSEVRTRTLDVHIRRLRRQLECFATRSIETVFSVGYRFKP